MVYQQNKMLTITTYKTITVDTKGTTYYGFVKDTEGFTSTCSITVKRDATGPINIKIVNPTGGNPTNKPFSLTVEGADPESGLEYWYYIYDKSDWKKYDSADYNSYEKTTFVTSPFSAERDQDVYFKVCDKVGQCTISAGSRIKIDKTAPSCSITASGTEGTNGWFVSNIAVSLTTSDTASKVQSYDLTTSSSATYNNNASKTQTEDTTKQTYYGHVKDYAGNTKTYNVYWTIDYEGRSGSTCKYGTGVGDKILIKYIK